MKICAIGIVSVRGPGVAACPRLPARIEPGNAGDDGAAGPPGSRALGSGRRACRPTVPEWFVLLHGRRARA
jgi:hypothetical protein